MADCLHCKLSRFPFYSTSFLGIDLVGMLSQQLNASPQQSFSRIAVWLTYYHTQAGIAPICRYQLGFLALQALEQSHGRPLCLLRLTVRVPCPPQTVPQCRVDQGTPMIAFYSLTSMCLLCVGQCGAFECSCTCEFFERV